MPEEGMETSSESGFGRDTVTGFGALLAGSALGTLWVVAHITSIQAIFSHHPNTYGAIAIISGWAFLDGLVLIFATAKRGE